ncbi:hypothetical protein H2202_003137 [Exophiala xenobiotica]|nr:hypothetical protein H2202_003137 [Exophiala xenobiotica]KAK5199811.1 hypothetical protein LTR92_000352 [Exophiala xenobiotica]KAK5210979.1 hypothetical protein LTR41_003591 [Exophiala xenobiotica]KAK5237433.1 hypothetical protein LTR47_001699 [Exophiala xenobiotica]KAK5254648.1 hypothetical protein LTS06_001138 [Exophiala xenobiotica]
MATYPGETVSIRTVKLKVLYTFDVEQKDNHLARWPHALNVQAAYIDETNQIGVIDLRTCLEAVTNASPELTANADNDFTIYAYDYSEPDTPLVGQGMLSKTLSDQDQGADSDNEAMVTGRITKNVMGLFSRNAQETLEVKLRLTPVNTFFQRNRSGSVSSQDGGRPWGNASAAPFTRSGSPVDTTGLEVMQRMLSGENVPVSGQPSRPGTPSGSQSFNAPSRQATTPSRPSSRAGIRQVSHGRRDSFNSGYYSGDENTDDGPARKRAKTMKVDWPTKSSLNIERQPDSLRVAASTASSVRLHRPVPINPSICQVAVPTEEPVRPPTPIPATKSGKPRGRPGRPRKNASSNLAHGPQVRGSSPALESVPQPEMLNIPITSPEETRGRSVSSTPANIPSSPPVMPDQSAITSPALPPMAHHDSGFMSGNLDDLFGDDQLLQFDDFIVDKPDGPDFNQYDAQQQLADASAYPSVFEDEYGVSEMPAEAPMPEIAPPPPPVSSRPLARAQSYAPAPRVSMSSPRLAPAPIPRARQMMEERREQQRLKPIAPALVPRSDPAPRMIQRAQTWAPDSDALMSDAAGTDETKAKAASKKKVGLEQTRARLESAIAKGEMPPFCDNCGSIETPAWRRAYVKVFSCGWDEVETSLGTGECCYKEVLERNADDTIKTFRGYKVEKRSGDEDDKWVAVILCNPCGLWFHKQRCPRPPEKWQKKDPKEKGKRKRNNNVSKQLKKGDGNANFKSDAQTPASDDSSPDTEAPDAEENDNEVSSNDIAADDSEPQLPPMSRTFRASSAEPGPKGLQGRSRHRPTGRQVQSSPGQARGSEVVPIEIDLTPKPVRRQLFPSPEKTHVRSDPGPITASARPATHLPAFVRRSPRLNKTRDFFATQPGTVAITVHGKENAAPAPAVVDDDLANLFEEGPVDIELPPMTPTPKRRSERLLLKTPSKTPQRNFGAELSPNADLLPSFRTPKGKPGHHAALAALLGTAHKSVLEMTPFSRSIHDALLSDAPYAENVPDQQRVLVDSEVKKTPPKKAISFDFPDLPSLKNSSPMSGDQLLNFSFSELTTDHLNSDFADPFATTATMPSSPPAGLFNFLDTERTDMDDMWEDMIDVNGGHSYPDPEASALTTSAQSIRRSPRNQRVK